MAGKRGAGDVGLSWLLLGDVYSLGAPGSASWEGLYRELKSLRSVAGACHLVLLTGDLVLRPDPRSYERLLEALEQVGDAVGADLSQFFVVPGNHDVNRDRCENEVELIALHDTVRVKPSRCERVMTTQGSVLARPLAEFMGFAARLGQPNDAWGWPSGASPWWVHKLRPHGHAVRLLGWNSALFSDESDVAGGLILPPVMLSALRKAQDDELVVVLSHHPPSWLRDHSSVLSEVEQRAHLWLHSHAHSKNDATAARRSSGLGLFSVGRAPEEQPGVRFSVCRLEATIDGPGLRAWPRLLSPDGTAQPDRTSLGNSQGDTLWMPLRPPGEGWIGRNRVKEEFTHDVVPGVMPVPSEPPIPDTTMELGDELKELEPPPPAPYVPPTTLPVRSSEFVVHGREEELRQLQLWLSSDGTWRGVVGEPGAGTSALVWEIARKMRAEGTFQGGVLWLDAGSPEALAGSIVRLREVLGERGEESVAPWEKIVLHAKERGRVLIVLDGIGALDTLNLLHEQFRSAPVVLLASAADEAIAQRIARWGGMVLRLAPLAVSPSTKVLQTTVEEGDRDKLERVAKAVGRAPFALCVARGVLETGVEPGLFASELLKRVGVADPTVALLDAAWRTMEEATQKAWLLVSMGVAEAPFPLLWLEGSLGEDTDTVLSSLCSAGVAWMEQQGSVPTLRLHRLAWVFGRLRLQSLDGDAQRRATSMFVKGLAPLVLDGPAFHRGGRFLSLLLPHEGMLEAALELLEGAEQRKLAAVVLLLVMRLGSSTRKVRVRRWVSAALSSDALGAPSLRSELFSVLRVLHSEEQASALKDLDALVERPMQLARWHAANSARGELDRARSYYEQAWKSCEESFPEEPLRAVVAREWAQLLLRIGTVEALQRAELLCCYAVEHAPVEERTAASELAKLVEEALRTSKAAGLRR